MIDQVETPTSSNTAALSPDLSRPELNRFEQMLEKSLDSALKPGGIALGEILRVDKDGLLVDIGGKSEGIVPLAEVGLLAEGETLENAFIPGQIKEFFILGLHEDRRDPDQAGHLVLSLRRVAAFKNWDRLSELKEAQTTVEAKVIGTTKGGVLVSILDLKGFIPASQLRVAKTLPDLVGDMLPAKILEVDKTKNKLILSHRQAIFEQNAMMRSDTLSRLHEGQEVEGEIVKVTDFGVFVDIYGIDGLLPLSEISWRRIKHPTEVLQLGQWVKVSVLTIDHDRQRISLSLKRLEQDPWQSVHQVFQVGQQLTARISKLLASGVLVELQPGIEAFCSYRHGRPDFEVDQSHTFEIISISPTDRRITVEYRA